MRAKNVSGYLLLVCGIAHVLLGILSGWPQLTTIYVSGIWNALGQKSQSVCTATLSCMQVNALWWFIVVGLMLLLLGGLCIWVERSLQRVVPAVIGWMLLVISAMSAILIPLSGFWAVMMVAMYIIYCDWN